MAKRRSRILAAKIIADLVILLLELSVFDLEAVI
jgi:hypothetical protein